MVPEAGPRLTVVSSLPGDRTAGFSSFSVLSRRLACPEVEHVSPASLCPSRPSVLTLDHQPEQRSCPRRGGYGVLTPPFSQDPTIPPQVLPTPSVPLQIRLPPSRFLAIVLWTTSLLLARGPMPLRAKVPCLHFVWSPCLAPCVQADPFVSTPFPISLTGSCQPSLQSRLSTTSFQNIPCPPPRAGLEVLSLST